MEASDLRADPGLDDFDALDRNHDGVIDRAEWIKGAQSRSPVRDRDATVPLDSRIAQDDVRGSRSSRLTAPRDVSSRSSRDGASSHSGRSSIPQNSGPTRDGDTQRSTAKHDGYDTRRNLHEARHGREGRSATGHSLGGPAHSSGGPAHSSAGGRETRTEFAREQAFDSRRMQEEQIDGSVRHMRNLQEAHEADMKEAQEQYAAWEEHQEDTGDAGDAQHGVRGKEGNSRMGRGERYLIAPHLKIPASDAPAQGMAPQPAIRWGADAELQAIRGELAKAGIEPSQAQALLRYTSGGSDAALGGASRSLGAENGGPSQKGSIYSGLIHRKPAPSQAAPARPRRAQDRPSRPGSGIQPPNRRVGAAARPSAMRQPTSMVASGKNTSRRPTAKLSSGH